MRHDLMNVLTSDFFSPFLWDTAPAKPARRFSPPADLVETDSHFVLSLDVPGVRKEDIRIRVENGNLFISGERKFEHDDRQNGRQLAERAYGHFERAFSLGTEVDADRVEAVQRDGVLTIGLAKIAAAKPRTVEIKDDVKGSVFGKILAEKKEEELKSVV